MPPFPAPVNASAAPIPIGSKDDTDFQQFMAGQDPVVVEAVAWLIRRQDGLTPQDALELEAWLNSDPRHAEALEEVEALWGKMGDLPSEDVDALRTAHLQNAARGEASRFTAAEWRSGWRRVASWLVPQGARLMALALSVALLGFGWIGWKTWRQQPVFAESYATLRGQLKHIDLPDGSQLWLDTATQAHVALYRDRREVRLPEGQAQFSVQSDAQKPFHVYAGAMRVTVVGTRFSVRNTRTGLGGGDVHVSVEEGRVRVALADEGAIVASSQDGREPAEAELTAGQSISAGVGNALGGVMEGPVAGHAAWREGRVSFNDVPLAQVLAEFERYGPTHLVVRDPLVASLRVHGSFDLRRLDAFASALPQVLAVRLRPAGGGDMEIVRLNGR